jgi:hypothetical protein
MAISRSNAKKSPTQNPVDFYKLKQSGGAYGSSGGRVGDQLTGGPQREKVMGSKSLKK